MAVSVTSLGIDQLTVAERLDLIEQIWDSLPEQVESVDVPEWHLVELSRRRAEVVVKPGVGKPWREVLDKLDGGS